MNKLLFPLVLLIVSSCSIPSAKDGKKSIPIPQEPNELALEDEIDQMLDQKSPSKEKKLERLKGKKKDYRLDLSLGLENTSFNEDLDGQTEIEGRMLGTAALLEFSKKFDEDFDVYAYGKLAIYGDAEFTQTSRTYKTQNTISMGGFLIHESWDRDIKPIIGAEREEISYVSADKELDLSTVNVFDQISGTKGLFYNALLGARYHMSLFDSQAIWTFMAGVSLLGEATSNKNELEQNLNSFKAIAKLRWNFSEEFFLNGAYQYSSIKGLRTTTYYNYAVYLGMEL